MPGLDTVMALGMQGRTAIAEKAEAHLWLAYKVEDVGLLPRIILI